ncbi:MAG: B12-binding domain-containing radical SAM protein [Lachnospiraceae bacterium]
MKVVLVAINAKYIHSNLAVHSLMKYARQYEDSIELAEYTINHQMDGIVRDLYERKPDVLMFSCYVWNIEYVKDAAREFHKVCPQVDIWLGGPEVSFDGTAILEKHPYLKGVMIGEGEQTFLELMECYSGEKTFHQIPGIMFRTVDDRGCVAIRSTPLRELASMDDIPFVYDDLSAYDNKIIYYESSRGCPFRCSYCMSSVDKTVRFRSMELVRRDLQFFLDHGVSQVKFIDRTFNIRVDRTMEILQYLYEHDNGITNFHFEVAADIITEEEIALFNKLRPGFVQLEIGVQSTNKETIAEIHRKMDFERVSYVARELKKPGNIHIHLDLIAGLPLEDMESFIHSFNDVYRLRPHELQLGFLKVLKGSGMHKKAEEYGLVYGDKAPYEVLCTRWMDFSDIIRLKEVEEMLEVYYNSGLFPHVMDYLEQFFESAFDLYDRLALYYRENDLAGCQHTRITRYQVLYRFIEENVQDAELGTQLLILDLYLRENLKTRPDFACPQGILKKQTRQIQKEYMKNHSGENVHFEPFTMDVLHYLATGERIKKDKILLFDYDHRHPVTRMAAVKEYAE